MGAKVLGIKVLLVGLESSAVDFDKWPHLTKESLEEAFERVRSMLVSEGFVLRWCLLDAGKSGRQKLVRSLETFEPHVVSIGAGVRADPEHLGLFEDLVNLVHELAPQARFAFNTDPMDTVESVKRAARRAVDEQV